VPADAPAGLGVAMRYGVLDGGKRLRPLLVLAATATGGVRGAALRAAAAVELIHAYSLMHDDMPCMDNDVLRRGKPTVHVQFGEAQAMLAGDAMHTLAFEILTARPKAKADFDTPPRCRPGCARCWPAPRATPAWPAGRPSTWPASAARWTEAALRDMHRRKTGALLLASVQMGAACGRPMPRPGRRWPTTAPHWASPSRWWTTSST
jgi:farnesyl diphosphate synthase